MASRWPFHNSSSSPIKSFITKSTSSSISLYPFIIFTHKQRSSFTFTHNHNSPTTCCSSRPNNAKRKIKKSDAQFTVGQVSVNEVVSVTNSDRSLNLNYKSLFGRRALWRRIFFASKKVRSIILLNVITLVYGK